eukprot:COSAG02_NODE_4689_length_5091_cov_1.795072_3_plen_60_part_00
MFARTAPQWSSLSSRRALRAVTYSLTVDGRRITSDSVSRPTLDAGMMRRARHLLATAPQ